MGLKPGSATRPFPGIEVDIVDDDGAPVGTNEDGNLVIKTPWPSMIRTVYGDDDRFISQYWEKYQATKAGTWPAIRRGAMKTAICG